MIMMRKKKKREEEGKEDMDQEEEEEEKPKKATRAVHSNPCPFPNIQEYLDKAGRRYIKWQRALTSFKNETNVQEKS